MPGALSCCSFGTAVLSLSSAVSVILDRLDVGDTVALSSATKSSKPLLRAISEARLVADGDVLEEESGAVLFGG